MPFELRLPCICWDILGSRNSNGMYAASSVPYCFFYCVDCLFLHYCSNFFLDLPTSLNLKNSSSVMCGGGRSSVGGDDRVEEVLSGGCGVVGGSGGSSESGSPIGAAFFF